MERLQQLIDSANQSGILEDSPVDASECELLFDHGWTHAIEVVSRDFFLIEERNTGWVITPSREEAEALMEP